MDGGPADERLYVSCPCGWRGPARATARGAVRAWDRAREHQFRVEVDMASACCRLLDAGGCGEAAEFLRRSFRRVKIRLERGTARRPPRRGERR